MIVSIQAISLQKKEAVPVIMAKIILHLILGSLCLSAFPVYINIAALGGMVLLFLNTLIIKDFFSFFLQLLFSNHLVFGSDNGGLYNLGGLLAIISYFLIYNKGVFTARSIFGKSGYTFFAILVISQLIAVLANDRIGMSAKIFSFGVFVLMVAIMYNLSKVKITNEDFIRFIYVLFFFSCYMLIVAVNQRLYIIDSPLLPMGNPNAEFELDLVRSGSVFLNYEAYAEYSLSLIVLLLPGILSGSFKKLSNPLFLTSLAIVIMSLFAIVLSGTRSSLLLLPVSFLFIIVCLGKRIKFGYLLSFLALAAGAFVLNSKYEFVDINIFMERSANMDLEHMSVKDLLSGSEMNRGEIFDYAFKKIGQSKGLIGEGYYTKEENYVIAHFDRINFLPTDYHNLYLSSIVLWGIVGAIALILFFFISIYKGVVLYFRYRHVKDYTIDLLLGFTTLFIFFMINEYKIQFIRASNYFVLIFLYLILYRNLIRNISKGQQSQK